MRDDKPAADEARPEMQPSPSRRNTSVGLAAKTYAAQKALELQQRREEHLAFVGRLNSPVVKVVQEVESEPGQGSTFRFTIALRNLVG
ncbi:MAG TPA: hypothetical protein VF611_18950 [Pyrinomonadaceae bacterium]|jgi:hypothetical protein